MTRFKELRRIKAAIQHKDEAELRWGLAYCQMRLRLTSTKHSEKHWKGIEKQIREVLESSES